MGILDCLHPLDKFDYRVLSFRMSRTSMTAPKGSARRLVCGLRGAPPTQAPVGRVTRFSYDLRAHCSRDLQKIAPSAVLARGRGEALVETWEGKGVSV